MWTGERGKRFARLNPDADLARALRPLIESRDFSRALEHAQRRLGTEGADRLDRQLRGLQNLYARLSGAGHDIAASGSTPRQSLKETTGDGHSEHLPV